MHVSARIPVNTLLKWELSNGLFMPTLLQCPFRDPACCEQNELPHCAVSATSHSRAIQAQMVMCWIEMLTQAVSVPCPGFVTETADGSYPDLGFVWYGKCRRAVDCLACQCDWSLGHHDRCCHSLMLVSWKTGGQDTPPKLMVARKDSSSA